MMMNYSLNRGQHCPHRPSRTRENAIKRSARSTERADAVRRRARLRVKQADRPLITRRCDV